MAGFAAPDFERLLNTELVGWAGDWHGNTQWAIHAIDSLGARGVSIIYHVGDFGLWGGQDGASYLRKVQRALGYNDMVLVVTPGNHENYDMLERFPLNDYGFHFRADVGRIWYAPRGHIWTHHGAYLASLGGAGSIDVRNRTAGRSWWPQEEITDADVQALKDSFASLSIPRVDVMMTHDCPAGVHLGPKGSLNSPEIEHYCYKQRVLLRDAVDAVTPRTLVHGHWHRHHFEQIDGVDLNGADYTTEVIGLDMDMSRSNLMVGYLAPASGIVRAEVVWR